TVMAMATIVSGIRDQIVETIEIAGPTTFYVLRAVSQTPVTPQDLPDLTRNRPELTMDEADIIQKLPEIKYAAIWGQINNKVEYAGAHTGIGVIIGADDGYSEIYGGDLTEGRWFTHTEEASGTPLAVLSVDVATKIFVAIPPIGKVSRICRGDTSE